MIAQLVTRWKLTSNYVPELLQNWSSADCFIGWYYRIGDPSGKDKTRKILSEDEIEKY